MDPSWDRADVWLSTLRLMQDDATCVNCGGGESARPLIQLRFRGRVVWLCAPCLPFLIHDPGSLAGKLEGAEFIPPSSFVHE